MYCKIIFLLCLIVTVSGCKKDPKSSLSIAGQWKFLRNDYVTIAGLQKQLADPNNPIMLIFEGSTYTQTESGMAKETGNYQLLNNYEIYPGDIDNVLKVNAELKARYQIHQASRDTLRLASIHNGPDFGGTTTYVRVK